MAKELTPAPVQIHGQIAFRLALRAGVVEGREPALGRAVVLELSMLHRGMFAVIDVMEENPVSAIPGYGEADGISDTR